MPCLLAGHRLSALFLVAPVLHHKRFAMVTAPSAVSGFDEDDARTVSFGQSVRLAWLGSLLLTDKSCDGFSGTLTLHAAGSTNARFGLDVSDGQIALTHHLTGFYVETLVHIEDVLVGSYVDLGIGSYFKMTLKEARREHIELLLQRITFTVASDLFLFEGPGIQVITVDLQEHRSGSKQTAQFVLDMTAGADSSDPALLRKPLRSGSVYEMAG